MVEGFGKTSAFKSPRFAHLGDNARNTTQEPGIISRGLQYPVLYLVPCLPKGFDLIFL
jgi:hypothetical protein